MADHGTESFILGKAGRKQAEVGQRTRDREHTKGPEAPRHAPTKHEEVMSTVAWLEVTDKRQGMDNNVYIYECMDRRQRLVDIVDPVILQNDLVVWGGNAYITFRPTWKPLKPMKVYGSAAAPNGMKKFRISQLAGKQVAGPGTPGCPVGEAERYEKKINLSREDPPTVEVTLGIDKVFVEGGGCMPMANNRVNPDSVMGLGNVVTGGLWLHTLNQGRARYQCGELTWQTVQRWLRWLRYVKHWGHQTRRMVRSQHGELA